MRPGESTIRQAIDQGVNYFFCYGIDTQMHKALRKLSAAERERSVIATGAYNFIWSAQDLPKTLDKRLRQLNTDYIDVFHFLGVTKPADFTPRVREQLEALRQDPRVRAVAISCHDRKFAAQLSAEGTLDCLMARYNAAHRGAETEVFPSLEAHSVGLISYTATRWSALLRRARRWPKSRPIPTPGQCYRFVLSNPNVAVCLTAPMNAREFAENIAAVQQGPLDAEEMQFMREYGDVVHSTARAFR